MVGAEGRRLSFFDRWLTAWIFLAIAAGVALGYFAPAVAHVVAGLKVGTTSLAIAAGLILMMYPPLAKVRYEEMGKVFRNKKLLAVSPVQNWLVGPVVMFVLAVVFLRGYPGFMVGVILVGLARCIAMVIVWNELAEGDRELAVGLVGFNALFQILFYAAYIWLFITFGLNKLGLVTGLDAHISMAEAAKTVFIYLGIPFLSGFVTRRLLLRARGRPWFERAFAPKLSVITPAALLFTIVVMFSLQGHRVVAAPLDVARVAVPLVAYFFVMWGATFFVAWRLRASYGEATAVAFTAASNDFELAIAVAIALFGIASPQAFATVIGPLLEVPILIMLVNVARAIRGRWRPAA